MTRTRALVARTGRKEHFATRGPGDDGWVPVCGIRDVPVFGTTITAEDDWQAWIDTARTLDTHLCSRCRTMLLVAGLAVAEMHSARIDALEVEGRRLRAELSRWTTAALAETKKYAAFVREHVAFRRAAR
jgi:hypothetical protein